MKLSLSLGHRDYEESDSASDRKNEGVGFVAGIGMGLPVIYRSYCEAKYTGVEGDLHC